MRNGRTGPKSRQIAGSFFSCDLLEEPRQKKYLFAATDLGEDAESNSLFLTLKRVGAKRKEKASVTRCGAPRSRFGAREQRPPVLSLFVSAVAREAFISEQPATPLSALNWVRTGDRVVAHPVACAAPDSAASPLRIADPGARPLLAPLGASVGRHARNGLSWCRHSSRRRRRRLMLCQCKCFRQPALFPCPVPAISCSGRRPFLHFFLFFGGTSFYRCCATVTTIFPTSRLTL